MSIDFIEMLLFSSLELSVNIDIQRMIGSRNMKVIVSNTVLDHHTFEIIYEIIGGTLHEVYA